MRQMYFSIAKFKNIRFFLFSSRKTNQNISLQLYDFLNAWRKFTENLIRNGGLVFSESMNFRHIYVLLRNSN